jgi:hypothetical protein
MWQNGVDSERGMTGTESPGVRKNCVKNTGLLMGRFPRAPLLVGIMALLSEPQEVECAKKLITVQMQTVIEAFWALRQTPVFKSFMYMHH